MSKITLCLPVSANDAVLAERLIDHCFFIQGKQQKGHALLAFYDVHAEMVAKLKIAAEVAFEVVHVLEVPKIQSKEQQGKNQYANHIFRHAAMWMQKNTRWPWIWMEADSVPLRPDWLGKLSEAYDAQPMRHMGSRMQAGDKYFMARVGVYHPNTFMEIDKVCESVAPCNVNADLIQKCTKTKLIQQMVISGEDDISKIRPDTVLLHGDKLGVVSEHLRNPKMVDKQEEIRIPASFSNESPSWGPLEITAVEASAPAMTPAQERMAKARAARKPRTQLQYA